MAISRCTSSEVQAKQEPKFALVEEALATWFGTMQAKRPLSRMQFLSGKGKSSLIGSTVPISCQMEAG